MLLFYVSLAFMLNLSKFVTSHPFSYDGTYIEPPEIKYFAMPESCKDKEMSFCFDNSGYPLEQVRSLFQNVTTLEVDNSINKYLPTYSSYSQGDIESDCIASATSDLIYYIIDELGNERVVVQLDGKFQQRFSVMWCQNEGQLYNRTAHFSKLTLAKYKVNCQNEYLDYEFLVLSLRPDFYGNYQLEKTRTATGIPICCKCKLQKS